MRRYTSPAVAPCGEPGRPKIASWAVRGAVRGDFTIWFQSSDVEATWLFHHCKNHDRPIIPVENQ